MLEEALWFAFRVGFGPAVWCFISQGQTSSPYHPQPAYPLEPGGCSPAQHWGGNSEEEGTRCGFGVLNPPLLAPFCCEARMKRAGRAGAGAWLDSCSPAVERREGWSLKFPQGMER